MNKDKEILNLTWKQRGLKTMYKMWASSNFLVYVSEARFLGFLKFCLHINNSITI